MELINEIVINNLNVKAVHQRAADFFAIRTKTHRQNTGGFLFISFL